MNPNRNQGGMTVSGLLYLGLALSALIPAVAFAILGVFALQNTDASKLMIVAFVCMLAVPLFVLIINYLLIGKVKDRFNNLADVCQDYIGGDRNVRVAVNGTDDFARLASSVNGLLDNHGPQNNIMLSSGGNDAAALQAQIEKLLQEVSAVGDGDLRVQAEVTPDTLGVLADSFNYMIEELAKVVGRVQSTAVQVTNATRRILDRAAELAQASEMQVEQISQTTEAVEALAIFIQNVAHNAQMSHESAQEALHNANSGQQAVRQTIDGMMLIRENVQETAKKIKRLGERSNEIGEIVRIIEDIADQTNLLALNAAIQSAMAGEHGRGFAVVADEIRLLAERSTESTKRIATLVKSIQGDTYEAVVAMEDSTQEVVKGSQLADEAGRALNSIYSAVERQAQMIENIARAATEQTTVSEAVAIAMSEISEVTRQNNVGTQETAASVSYLSELAEQLRASVSTFRLPEHVQDSISNVSGVGGLPGLPAGNGDPFYGAGMDNGWGQQGQGFSGNFPPLPEPDNAGLVALSSRAGQGQGQFAFTNQQDHLGGQGDYNNQFNGQQGFGGQQGDYNNQFNGQQGFGGQQGDYNNQFNGQQGFGGQQGDYNNQFNGHQGFNDQQGFGGQQGFGSFDSSFGGQQGFDGQQGFGEQQGFGGQPSFGGQQGFGEQPSFGGQQQFFPSQPGQPGYSNPNQNPQAQPPHQAPAPGRQPWPAQNQSAYNQDPPPFQNPNGQFGQ